MIGKLAITLLAAAASYFIFINRKKSLLRYLIPRLQALKASTIPLKLPPPSDEAEEKLNVHTIWAELNGKRLRTVYIRHKLGNEVPLIFFVHGNGGQILSFKEQIAHFSNLANVLAIEFVGHGSSPGSESKYDYSTESILNDMRLLLQKYMKKGLKDIIIISHSYGTSLSVKLYQDMKQDIKALILIGSKPKMTEKELAGYKKLLKLSPFVFNIYRIMDRWGGENSHSVNRQLGSKASRELRLKQLNWNKAVKTRTVQLTTLGMNWASEDEFKNIECPVLLIGGAEDKVTPSVHLCELYEWISKSACHVPKPYIIPGVGHQIMIEEPKVTNALIYRFLVDECKFGKMSNEYQILLVNDPKDKWNLKNFQKWLTVPDVTKTCIGPSLFRAMKVMKVSDATKHEELNATVSNGDVQEDHDQHSPKSFLTNHREIGCIIDISKDPPPYDISEVEANGCKYVKVSTVSKVPPSRKDVEEFIKIAKKFWAENPEKQIAVHCHYGYNRTGFMICSYLIEVMGISIKDAVSYFNEARPPGIRHEHFIYELTLRYCDIGRSL